MATKSELEKGVSSFFEGEYEITQGKTIPSVDDIALGKVGRELEMAMLFIDIRESTKIVDGFRRITSARMCELPPPYGGGLHEFQLMLSGVFSALLLNISANYFLIDTNRGHEVAV